MRTNVYIVIIADISKFNVKLGLFKHFFKTTWLAYLTRYCSVVLYASPIRHIPSHMSAIFIQQYTITKTVAVGDSWQCGEGSRHTSKGCKCVGVSSIPRIYCLISAIITNHRIMKIFYMEITECSSENHQRICGNHKFRVFPSFWWKVSILYAEYWWKWSVFLGDSQSSLEIVQPGGTLVRAVKVSVCLVSYLYATMFMY